MYKRYSSISARAATLASLTLITVLAAFLLAGTRHAQAEARSTTSVDSPAAITSAGGTLTATPSSTLTPTATGTPTRPSSPTTLVTRTATPSVTPCPMSFTDVHPTDYFYAAVSYLYCEGAISGYADNTFRPYNYTTRAQISKIVVLAMHWPIDTQGGPHFSDVPTDNSFYVFVETAYNHQIIFGYSDGTFRPNNNVTRGQLAKIIVLAIGWGLDCESMWFCDVPYSDPFHCYVQTVFDHNVMSGYSDCTFRPYNPTTRGQVSKVVYLAVTAR